MLEYKNAQLQLGGIRSQLSFFIDEALAKNSEAAICDRGTQGLKRVASRNAGCKKLSYEYITDKLDSQPDLFGHNQMLYRQSKSKFQTEMRVILEWMCQNLLFDSFEFVFWMTIIEQDNFDILIVREKTMLQSNLPL